MPIFDACLRARHHLPAPYVSLVAGVSKLTACQCFERRVVISFQFGSAFSSSSL